MRTQIEQKLTEAVKSFEKPNNAFILSIFHNNVSLIQVVHSSYIEVVSQPNNEFGLAVNVTFDPSFPAELDNHKKFKQLSIFNKFTAYNWDGILCYATNVNTNVAFGAELLNTLLTELYNLSSDSRIEIELVDQGKL